MFKSDDPHDIRLKKINLMSLKKRRSLTNVIFLYKVFDGNIDIGISKILEFHLEDDRFSLRSITVAHKCTPNLNHLHGIEITPTEFKLLTPNSNHSHRIQITHTEFKSRAPNSNHSHRI